MFLINPFLIAKFDCTWNLNFDFKFQVFPSRQDRKTNSFVRFLGEAIAQQFCFEIYWPLTSPCKMLVRYEDKLWVIFDQWPKLYLNAWAEIPNFYFCCFELYFRHVGKFGYELKFSIPEVQKWYFVTKIVLTYCEKKLFQRSRKTFEIRGWRARICKIFEITRTIRIQIGKTNWDLETNRKS